MKSSTLPKSKRSPSKAIEGTLQREVLRARSADNITEKIVPTPEFQPRFSAWEDVESLAPVNTTSFPNKSAPPLKSFLAIAGRQAGKARRTVEKPVPEIDLTPYIPSQAALRATRPLVVARHATIACVVPAYNEEESIASVIESLLGQTRPPDHVFVIVNNTTDKTTRIAKKFEGSHQITVEDQTYQTFVEVHDIGKNSDKKVGALNYGWRLAWGHDFFLGVDGDTTLEKQCVEWLEKEMVDDSRIGGISAIYSIDHGHAKSLFSKFLVLGQRAQFAGFNMDNLVRNRSMAVLGGQCSLFRMEALEHLLGRYNQDSPWVRDSEVEDSLLSLQLKDKAVNFQTKISARARAYVGPMTTTKALHNQQVKWTHGAIELMRDQPFHPNLRLRWKENISMIFNILSRLLFVILLVASLSIHAFVLNLVWLIPPAVAVMLNLRNAMSMHDRKTSDVLFALLVFPAEAYMLLRINHFLTSWYRSLARIEKDNWAAQAAAESGKGNAGFIWPVVAVVVGGVVIIDGWRRLDAYGQSLLLSIGWPMLGVVASILTVMMLKQLTRRQKGFKV